MMLAGQLGLEPGPLGHVYLVPFKDEVTLVIGYRGLIDLGYRSGLLKSIAAVTVREGDEFQYREGTRPFLDHIRAGSPEGREPVAYYAVAHLKTGGAPFVVLYPDDIERTQSKAPGSSSSLSPWNTHFDAMARKTAVRRLAPMLPQSPVFAQAVAADGLPVTVDEDTLAIETGEANAG
jgi:recombination protein RecT